VLEEKLHGEELEEEGREVGRRRGAREGGRHQPWIHHHRGEKCRSEMRMGM
jgi:hypothetical protein